MKQKIFISFLDVVLAHYLIGCVTHKNIYLNEIEYQNAGSEVLSLILKSDEEIYFDENNGRLIFFEESISGETDEGKFVSIPFSNVTKLYGGENGIIISKNSVMLDTSIKIIKLWQAGGTVTFNSAGGRYSKDSCVVRGTTYKGEFIKVAFQEVKAFILRAE